jgi:1-acyl-sn-glycerol-3-phosphate acyltransferase
MDVDTTLSNVFGGKSSGLFPGPAHISIVKSKETGVPMTPDGMVVFQTEKHAGGGLYKLEKQNGKPVSKGEERFLRDRFDVFAHKPLLYHLLSDENLANLQTNANKLADEMTLHLTENPVTTYDLKAEAEVFKYTTTDTNAPAFTVQHNDIG